MKPNAFRTSALILLTVGSLSLTGCGGVTIQATGETTAKPSAQGSTLTTPETQDAEPTTQASQSAEPSTPATSSAGPTPTLEPTTPAPEPPDPTEDPEPEPARQGTYRITVNGIQVHHETWDHAGEADGRRDEIQVSVAAKHLDENGKSLLPVSGEAPIAKTIVMGDSTKDRRPDGTITRWPAGSAWNPLPFGGIQTGDKISAHGHEPWSPLAIDPSNSKLPLRVGEFTLTEGKGTLTVIPTIWEIDGGSDLPSAWVKWLRDEGDNVPVVGGIVKEVGKLATSLFDNIIGHAGDRPIGIQKQNADGYEFAPQALELNYSTAESLVNGADKGIVSIWYKDFKDFAGDYQLWIEVKKIA